MKRFLPILMALMICFVSVMPAFAADFTLNDLPDPDVVWVDKDTYPHALIINQGSSWYLILCQDEPYLSNGFYVVTSKPYALSPYNDITGEWGSLTVTSYGYSVAKTDVAAVSSNVKDPDGNVVFSPEDTGFFLLPLTLVEQVQGVTEETLLNQTLPAMGGTMKTLVLCGVGLIASLVFLKLFGKRSLISLR